MGSLDREVKDKQLQKAEAEFEAYKATLAKDGIDDKKASKDVIYRKLRAQVKTARKRIASIEAAMAHVEAMKEKDTKAEKVAKEPKKAVVQAMPAKKKASPKKKK